MKPTTRKRNWIITAILDVLCLIFTPLYLVFSEIDERYHRGKEWDVSAPAKPEPPTKMCPHCQHGTPENSNYCTHCGKCVHVAILALAPPSHITPLRIPKTRSAVLNALAAAGSPAYNPDHSNPRLFAASVLFPSDTAIVPSVRVSGNLSRERDTPPGIQRYGEVSNG